MKDIIITGRPGSGKSTIIRRTVERLKDLKIDVAGVITPERREDKGRVGFEAVGIKSGKRKILAIKDRRSGSISSKVKIGKYCVFPENFLEILYDELRYNAEVFVIDEIGPMELGGSKNLNTEWIRKVLSLKTQKVLTVKKDLSYELFKMLSSAIFIDIDTEPNHDIPYAKVLEAITQTEALLIDLDGVIIDSGEFHKLSWIELMRKLGVNFSEEDFRKTFGMTNSTILKMFLREISSDEIKRLSEEKEKIYRELAKGKIKPIEGAIDFLRFVKEIKGFRTALVSSTPRKNIDFIFSELGIGKLFDVVISGEDVEQGKPNPECYIKALTKMGVDPKKAWVLEDSQHGIYAANGAGTKSIGILTTQNSLEGADIVVKSFAELLNFFNSLKM